MPVPRLPQAGRRLRPRPHRPVPARATTSAANLHALCRRHHRLKHETGWQVTAQPGNRLEWTSPLGAVYTTDPPDPGGEACTQTRTWCPVEPAAAEAGDPDGEWLADLALAAALARADDPDDASDAGPDWAA